MVDVRRRPFGVGLLSILIIVMGIMQIGAGIFFLVDRNDDDLLSQIDSTSSELQTAGITTIIVGVIGILVGLALRRGAKWARLLVGIIALVNIGFAIWMVAAYDSVHWYNVFWPAVIYTVIAVYLFADEDAKGYFA